MDKTQKIIDALDPCRSDLKDLATGDVGAPKFGEPWHAQVFGLAMALAQAGQFTWAKWVDTFSTEIRANPQQADETSEEAYYRQWSSALVRLLEEIGAMDDADLADTIEAWRRSYLHTEHGQPIAFRRDLPKPDYDHVEHHHHHAPAHPPAPVAVSSSNS